MSEDKINKGLLDGSQQGEILTKYYTGKFDIFTAFLKVSLELDFKNVPSRLVTKMLECFSAIYANETKQCADWVVSKNFYFRHTWSIIGKCLQETWGGGKTAEESKDVIKEHLIQAFIFAVLNEIVEIDIKRCLDENFSNFTEEYFLGCGIVIPEELKTYDQLDGIAGTTLISDRTNASTFAIALRLLNEEPMKFLDDVIAYVE